MFEYIKQWAVSGIPAEKLVLLQNAYNSISV